MHLLVIRHGRSTANTSGVLAGRDQGVHLDDHGRQQAEALVERLKDVEITRIIGSPMTRCKETAEALVISRRLKYEVDERLNEVEYGDWSGRSLSDVAKDPLWTDIQQQPSKVVFPGGEAMATLFSRSVDVVEEMRVADGVVALFTHGDVAKAILAYCIGVDFDLFQRIVIDPASVSVVRLEQDRTFVLRMNDSTTSLKEMTSQNITTVGGNR